MRVIVYSTKPYDKDFLTSANECFGHDLKFIEARLTSDTVALAEGYPAVCIFVNDEADSEVIAQLRRTSTGIIALRCAGFSNVDLKAAEEQGLCVARVPAYSPHAVAEHTIGLILALNRHIPRARDRVREGNFSLQGLLGFDMKGKTVGVVGTGRIGSIVANALHSGFGCTVLAFDVQPNEQLRKTGIRYAPLDELLAQSDIISLHAPLTPDTRHMIKAESIEKMKTGVMLINTSRGRLIDTAAVIDALKSGQVGWLGLDVYEEEADLFFEDLSNEIIHDDVFARLLTFPNVIVTAHQAYFTREALENIAHTTLENIAQFERNEPCANAVYCDRLRGHDAHSG